MEDTVIVIMLKDAETGFLEKELGAYPLPENSGLIFNIYAETQAQSLIVKGLLESNKAKYFVSETKIL